MNPKVIQALNNLNISKEERSSLADLINRNVQEAYNLGVGNASSVFTGNKETVVAYDETLEQE